MKQAPIFKEIVLAGGGHAHALALRKWAMRPLPGVRLTLISPQPWTPYSGMLPGLIAGHYAEEQVHIDLARLCRWAGARFIQDRLCAVEPENRLARLAGRPPLAYDLLSLNIGSRPDCAVPGVAQHAAPVKPISEFHQRWRKTLHMLRQAKGRQTIAVVGGGAGSVEIMLAMAAAIQRDPLIAEQPAYELVFQSETILPGYPGGAIKAVMRACRELGVALRGGFAVSRVEPGRALDAAGRSIAFDQLFWCAQAGAPDWLPQQGLACSEAGFVLVNQGLQSISHPEVFAVGDIAELAGRPLPKAGVYAVRQAPVLLANLRNAALERPLASYRPQRRFLSLLALGNKRASGARGIFAASGDWVWRWKNRIDQRFMKRFRELPELDMARREQDLPPALVPPAEREEKLSPAERCGGCGAKLGAEALNEVLTELTGAYQAEDASIIQWQGDLAQSVDLVKAPFDDPYLLGRISVFHALNDLHAMNASSHSIQVALSLPFAGREVQKRELRQLMQGILSACAEEDVQLLGGHSAEGGEASVCLTVNGIAGERGFRKQGLEKGDLLALNKPLGSGLALAAQMGNAASGRLLEEALAVMNRSNRPAAELLARLGVKCCTDVSGFGLLGHLAEMLGAAPRAVELYPERLPLLSGVRELAAQGIRSSLMPQNEAAVLNHLALGPSRITHRWADRQENGDPAPVESLRGGSRTSSERAHWVLLLDPQTAGGLLAAIPEAQRRPAEAGGFSVIGRVCD